jgi:hypothetical protein
MISAFSTYVSVFTYGCSTYKTNRNIQIPISAGMELYRALPLSIRDSVAQLEAQNEAGKKWAHVNESYFHRLGFTKAAVCFKNKSVSSNM